MVYLLVLISEHSESVIMGGIDRYGSINIWLWHTFFYFFHMLHNTHTKFIQYRILFSPHTFIFRYKSYILLNKKNNAFNWIIFYSELTTDKAFRHHFSIYLFHADWNIFYASMASKLILVRRYHIRYYILGLLWRGMQLGKHVYWHFELNPELWSLACI